MKGIYRHDRYGGLEIWWSIDDFTNGYECNAYMQSDLQIEAFLEQSGSEEEVFDSANYMEVVI